ncbi:MAG: alanine racemase [Gemmatimonadaceae bacterium]
MNRPALPLSLYELETPVPVVDLDRMACNLDRMASYARQHGLDLRPHTKTHKSPRIAAEQVERGAVGLTCATVREVEVMGEVTTDILMAYPPVGAAKLRRLMEVDNNVRLSVALDSGEALDQLATAASESGRVVGVLVELDLGMRRVGVSSVTEAIRLARSVTSKPSLKYAGVAFYPGHIREHVNKHDEQLASLRRSLDAVLRDLRSAGVPPGIVSGGSTPTAWRTHEIEGVTEFRPGTYVYNDRTTVEIGACDWTDCALTVLATVVSISVPGQAVIDAGSKALGREPLRGSGGGGGGGGLR